LKNQSQLKNEEIILKISLRNFLSSWQLLFICRLILGGIFVYASIDKIAHPFEFAKIIYNFRLLPDELIYIAALIMPWLELITGLLLVSGIFQRAAAFILSILLAVFIVALTINLIRGVDISCGCFSTSSEYSNLLAVIIRDVLMFIPAGIVFLFGPKTTSRDRKHS